MGIRIVEKRNKQRKQQHLYFLNDVGKNIRWLNNICDLAISIVYKNVA